MNLVTTNAQRTDLAIKVPSCDVIIPEHCLTRLKIVEVL